MAHHKFPTPSGAPPGSRGNLKMSMISMVDTQSLGVFINGVLHMVNIWFIYIYIRKVWLKVPTLRPFALTLAGSALHPRVIAF